jgi:hypothetical protein
LIVRARSLAAAKRNSTGALFEFHGMVVALAAIAGRLGRRRFDKAAKNANRFITRRCQRACLDSRRPPRNELDFVADSQRKSLILRVILYVYCALQRNIFTTPDM